MELQILYILFGMKAIAMICNLHKVKISIQSILSRRKKSWKWFPTIPINDFDVDNRDNFFLLTTFQLVFVLYLAFSLIKTIKYYSSHGEAQSLNSVPFYI